MSNIWDEKKKAQEDDYFRRRDQELIEKARRQQQEGASPAPAAGLAPCPKCGGQFEPVSFMEINIDRCASCKGVWLDPGELEQLARRDEGGWLGKFWQRSK